MGNDGGSIPTRRELVKEAARDLNSTELKETLQEQQVHNWTTCPLSQRPLVQPVVSDSSGRLYNKDAVLELILPSEDESVNAAKVEKREMLQGRISGIRDVVTVSFQVDSETSRQGPSRQRREKWICPVTGKELGPNTRAVYLVPCGHAFSKIAITEVNSNMCIQCNEPFESENVIPILSASVAERQILDDRIAKLKQLGLTHSLKKAPNGKKRKHNAASEPANGKAATEKEALSANEKLQGAKDGEAIQKPIDTSQGIKDAATAALTAKVLAQEKEQRKRRKFGMNENIQSLYTADTNSQSLNKTGDFMTRGYSIPTNAKR